MHILIIDDSSEYRLFLQKMLGAAFPDATVGEYDPLAQGRPGSNFPWGDYDLLILDHQLGHDTGLDWLKEFRGNPAFPATIFLTGEGDEMVAVKALKLGVKEYIRKEDLTLKILKTAIIDSIASKSEALSPETTQKIMQAMSAEQRASLPAIDSLGNLPFSEKEINSGNARMGEYHIKGLLGRGGMATVYLAKKEDSDLEVAIKFLDADLNDEQYIDRFIEEYSLLTSLEHPNLIRIYEQGFTDNFGYIAMEFMPGGDLRERLDKDEGIPYDMAINCMRDITSALHTLHEAKIIHRDLKPNNVLFRDDGSLALTDFGTAKKLDENLELTRHGEIIGTPLYISPEQIQDLPVDKRSDLYSLGIMFYEMLAGKRPFVAKSIQALMYKHLQEIPEDIPDIPANINVIVQKLLAKNPDDRYQDTKVLQMQLAII